MFRRFMIVCWGLFAISATCGAICWGIYGYYESQWDSYTSELAEVTAATKIKSSYDASIVEELIQDLEDQEQKQRMLNELKKFRAIEENLPAAPDIDYQIRLYEGLAFYGGTIAAIIVLWNVIWHVGHWIWMGRKSEPDGI